MDDADGFWSRAPGSSASKNRKRKRNGTGKDKCKTAAAVRNKHEPSKRRKLIRPDAIAAATAGRKLAEKQGRRRYECHVCGKQFSDGRALQSHLQTTKDGPHSEHRGKMRANAHVSKITSVKHRAQMLRKAPNAERGVGAQVHFFKTGDVVKVVAELPSSWAWKLANGRICKFKTEGQHWVWQSDWLRGARAAKPRPPKTTKKKKKKKKKPKKKKNDR